MTTPEELLPELMTKFGVIIARVIKQPQPTQSISMFPGGTPTLIYSCTAKKTSHAGLMQLTLNASVGARIQDRIISCFRIFATTKSIFHQRKREEFLLMSCNILPTP